MQDLGHYPALDARSVCRSSEETPAHTITNARPILIFQFISLAPFPIPSDA